jgi:phosphoribosylformimino-5-aminoimidazole carboxamide ribotide isomerase
VFQNGQIHYDNLEAIRDAVGKEHLVLDLSCRKRDGRYYVVTDRWQKYTDVVLSKETLDHLSSYCDEFLIHAVDVEGKASGIEEELVAMIGDWNQIPVTYAGGVRSERDLALLKELGHGQLDVTIGSALDLFGGDMKFERVLEYCD